MPVHLTSREALRIFDVADIWATRTGQTVRIVSANDHAHRAGSAHYSGLALDIQSSNPTGLAAALRSAGYRVLWNVPGHYGHVHAQSDLGAEATPRPLRWMRPQGKRPERRQTSFETDTIRRPGDGG
jgi:hypothetical protein